jgi:hypothetical protein
LLPYKYSVFIYLTRPTPWRARESNFLTRESSFEVEEKFMWAAVLSGVAVLIAAAVAAAREVENDFRRPFGCC